MKNLKKTLTVVAIVMLAGLVTSVKSQTFAFTNNLACDIEILVEFHNYGPSSCDGGNCAPTFIVPANSTVNLNPSCGTIYGACVQVLTHDGIIFPPNHTSDCCTSFGVSGTLNAAARCNAGTYVITHNIMTPGMQNWVIN
jgi:hypothetical protein